MMTNVVGRNKFWKDVLHVRSLNQWLEVQGDGISLQPNINRNVGSYNVDIVLHVHCLYKILQY
jgi:hypothetical protein